MRNFWATLGFSVLLFMGSASQAQNSGMESPAELLEEAAKGPMDYLEAIERLDSYRPELRSRGQAEPYVMILADLEKIGQDLQVGEIAAQAFKSMASKLTQHSIRWVDVFSDPKELVLRYHLYADEPAAQSLLEQIQSSVGSVTDEGARRQGAVTLASLQEWAKGKKFSRFIIESYRETRSDLAVQALLPIGAHEFESVSYWTGHLSPQQGYERYLIPLQEWVLSLTPEQPEQYQLATRISGRMGELIRAGKRDVPQYSQSLNSDIAREIFARMIEAEVVFDDEAFNGLLLSLDRAALQSLAGILVSREYIPSPEYAQEYLKRMEQLLALPQWGQMTREKEELKKYFAQIASALHARIDNLEGTWRLKGSDGKVYRFNLIFARENELRMGLAEEGDAAFVYFTFHYVGYDLQTRMFVASENEPDSTTRTNAVLKLRYENGRLTGILDTNLSKNTSFVGEKIEPYEDFLYNGPRIDTDGTYRGEMECDGWSSRVQLSLVTINGFQMGRMHIDRGNVNLTFETGLYSTDSNAVYLTTTARSLIHFRAERIGDELVNGQYILGGVGLVCDGVRLKKDGGRSVPR